MEDPQQPNEAVQHVQPVEVRVGFDESPNVC